MYARIVQLLILGLLAIGVFGLAPASAGASSGHEAARTPSQAVLLVTRPFYDRSAQQALCNAVTGKIAACPLTPRLRAALARELQWERAHTRGGNGNAFCRCQNPPTRVDIRGVVAQPQSAQVATTWHWGARIAVNLTFVTRRASGGWQIDDELCAGRPRTNMYHNPIGPCL